MLQLELEKPITATTYNYDQSGRLVREIISDDYSVSASTIRELIFLYDESGMIGVTFTDNSGFKNYYFLRNLQGDVIAIYNSSGELAVEYVYDAFGNCQMKNVYDSVIAKYNPIRYRGYYYDDETGFYYCNSRYYNPEWGRWISPDDTAYLNPETPDGLNLYVYCNNDPVNNVDPTGHAWYNPMTWDWGEIIKGIGLIVTGVSAIAVGIVTLPYGGWIAAVAGGTILAGGGTALFGLSDIGEGVTDYNVIQEAIFMGNEYAYNIAETIFATTATIGSIICGGYIKYNTTKVPRSLPGQGQKPHSGIWNVNDKTLGYYGADGRFKYSIAFNNHGTPKKHRIPHWHTEMPHSSAINSFWKFVIEFIKRGF